MDSFSEPVRDRAAEADAEEQKEARFRALVQVGLDQIERGEVIRVDDVRGWLDSLGRGPVAS